MKGSCRLFSTCGFILFLIPFCFAQDITIRVVNAQKGHPLPKFQGIVQLFYEKNDQPNIVNIDFETNENGIAQFALPEPEPTRIFARLHIDYAHWTCPWAAFGTIQDLIQKGFLETLPKYSKSAVHLHETPGEVIFLVHRLNFCERIMYQLMKG
jgi:hypothetical protein